MNKMGCNGSRLKPLLNLIPFLASVECYSKKKSEVKENEKNGSLMERRERWVPGT
jgi:hypothetical protein